MLSYADLIPLPHQPARSPQSADPPAGTPDVSRSPATRASRPRPHCLCDLTCVLRKRTSVMPVAMGRRGSCQKMADRVQSTGLTLLPLPLPCAAPTALRLE
jgi:hypothetical protein